MIVVDVNILAFHFIQGEKTERVKALRAVDAEWVVPEFWLVEFQSILWKYVRLGGMPEGQALDLLDRCRNLIASNENTPVPDRALSDAIAFGISVYDAQYISLAKQLGIACITEDTLLHKACPGLALSINDYIAFRSGRSTLREKRKSYRPGSKRSNPS